MRGKKANNAVQNNLEDEDNNEEVPDNNALVNNVPDNNAPGNNEKDENDRFIQGSN